MQVSHAVVGKKALDNFLELASLHDLSRNHDGRRVVSANGQETMSEHDRDFSYSWLRRSGAAANEDGARRPIRRRNVVMREVQQNDRLTHFTVDKAHATGKPRLFIDDHSSSTYRGQFLVALLEEGRELLGFQRDQLK